MIMIVLSDFCNLGGGCGVFRVVVAGGLYDIPRGLDGVLGVFAQYSDTYGVVVE